MKASASRNAVRVALFLLLLCVLSVEAKADPVTITFDNIPSGGNPNLSPNGIIFYGIHTNASGAVVSTGGGVVLSSDQSNTAPNALFGSQLNPLAFLRNNIAGEFLVRTQANTFSSATTDFVSLYVVGTVQGQTDEWTVAFYDETFNNNDLTVGLIGSVSGTTDQLVSFSANRGIHAFVLINSGPNRHEGIDTVTFNSPEVPEPATLLLLGSGLVGFGVKTFRQRRQSRMRGDSAVAAD